ncbi:MAG: YkgJ family cysteine cluster protein [Moraxella sp.]
MTVLKKLNFDNLPTPFPCTACGQCCRRVGDSSLTAYLSRGDGVCQYLDEDTNLCQIYENRPLICQVENYYKTHLKDKLSWEQFVAVNVELCQKMQQ